MSPESARALSLRAEIQRAWDQVEAHLAKARSADPAAGPHEAAFVALSLDHAYQGWESLLVRVERGLGLPERNAGGWHRELLAAAGRTIPGLRPAVYPADVAGDWVELLGFRHFLRHAYEVELDPVRLGRLVVRLDRAVSRTEPHVAALVDALAAS